MESKIKQVFSAKRSSTKHKVALPVISLHRSHFPEEKIHPKNITSNKKNNRNFSALQFLWQQKCILLEDYLTACKYVELAGIIRKISGYPQGFYSKVVWCKPFDTSRISWIQSDLAMLEQDFFPNCSDEDVLILWKRLQSALCKVPISMKVKFEQLLFEDTASNFQAHFKTYLKSFQKIIPLIKVFMLAFWKNKSPH